MDCSHLRKIGGFGERECTKKLKLIAESLKSKIEMKDYGDGEGEGEGVGVGERVCAAVGVALAVAVGVTLPVTIGVALAVAPGVTGCLVSTPIAFPGMT